MHLASSFVLLTSGMAAGMALVLSCGDDSPGRVDAAVDAPVVDAPVTCDCPAAEPPLAGRFVIVSNTTVIPSNDTGAQSALCPEGSQVISGSCTTATLNPVRDVTLQQSGFYEANPTVWSCLFKNNEAAPVTVKASVICLKPTP